MKSNRDSSSQRRVTDNDGEVQADSLAPPPRPPRLGSTSTRGSARQTSDGIASLPTNMTDHFPTYTPYKTKREAEHAVSRNRTVESTRRSDIDAKIKAKSNAGRVKQQPLAATEVPWNTTSEQISSSGMEVEYNRANTDGIGRPNNSKKMFPKSKARSKASTNTDVDNRIHPGAVAIPGEQAHMDAASMDQPELLLSQQNVNQTREIQEPVVQRNPSEHLLDAVLVEDQPNPPQQSELPYAEATTVPPEKPWWRTRPFYIGVGFLLLGVIIAVSVAVATTRSSSPSPPASTTNTSPPPATPAPTSNPTSAPSPSPTQSRLSVLQSLVAGFSQDGSLPTAESAQGMALGWLIDDVDSQVPLSDTDRLTTRYALAVFYFSTQGSIGWFDGANFLSSDHECDWRTISSSFGVECDSSRRVVSLNIPDNRVVGTIPPEIGLLSFLSRINLRGSFLNGNNVNLRSNALGGSIPAEVGNLSRLVALDLSGTGALSGTIPTEIAQLTNLLELRLNDCRLNGMVPEDLGFLPSSTFISLSNNFLTGAVPESLKNIRCLLLDGNEVTCDWLLRRRLQVSIDPEGCSYLTPPCGL